MLKKNKKRHYHTFTQIMLPITLIITLIISIFISNFSILTVYANEVLTDADFSTSADSAALIANGGGQDWYESRNQSAPAQALLALDETDVGGNATKKAHITGDSTLNTYLSQELSAVPTASFTAQWDIYVDSIINIGDPDRTGLQFIGYDGDASNGPNSTNDDRWSYMAWEKVGGGDTGAVSLTYRDNNDGWTSFSVASSTLALDTWYTIKVVGNVTADTYDIYVDDMLQVSGVTARNPSATPSHISFASWNDGAGTFYVDNVTFDDGVGTVALAQNSFRWYANADVITPTDPWPSGGTDLAEDTNVSATYKPSDEDIMRLRMSILGSGAQLDASDKTFKLQFGTGGTCSSVSDWQDIGTMASTTAPWRGYNNASVADDATISSLVLSGSDVGGTYEEENNSAVNPNAIAVGEDAEWDWVLQAHTLADETNYCFRMVESDDTVLDTYTNYPQVMNSATTFDASFEGGNGENFVRVGNAVSFDGELDIGAGGFAKTTWFYFSMDNVLGDTIAFTMENARGANTETSTWTGKRPFYSYDQITWYPATNDGTDNNPAFDWNAPGDAETFTQDTVYIAYGIPYTYTDAQTDITRWELSPFASSTAVLGTSVQGRDIHLVTFEDINSPIAYGDKKVMWVDSRQHPMENNASYHARGLVDFYIDADNPEAEVFRQGWILKIIPDLNADGMFLGQTRSNANGYDLNREWDAGGPDDGTEEAEVYLAHNAMQIWTDAGNSIDIFFDMHTKSSAAPGAYYGGSINTEVMEDGIEILSNMPLANFAAGGYCIDVVDSNYGAPSYTVEGPDVRWDANNYPTKANSEAWGRAWAMAAVAQFETNAKIFSFHEVLQGDGPSSATKTLVTAPGKFHAVFDQAKGGAMTYWYDIENQSTHTAQLGDLTNGVDRIIWDDGTNRNLADSTSVATSSTYLAGSVVMKRTYSGTFANVSNYDYTLSKTIWEDGRIWNSFSLTNNTGSTVDWADMSFYNSLTNTNFTLSRDNSDDTPTPGTDNWWAQIGDGGSGIKAVIASYFVSQTGDWVYDTHASAAGPPGTTYYQDADGPTQADGATITVNWVQQIGYDNDILANEAAIDVYRDDIANPDTPTASKGTFTEFSAADGGLKFASSANKAVFTYTNADTYTKKRPSFILTGYTADTAPVLKANGSFLDSETGTVHATSTYIGASYTSTVDKDNDIAYVQYLDDVSSNVEIQMGASLPTAAPSDASVVTATYNSNIQITVTWTDNSDDEDGFIIQRRDDTGSGWGSYTQVGTVDADVTTFVDNVANNASNPPAANERYQYKVIAQNIAGNASGAADASAIDTGTATPTIGTPTINSSAAITWAWTDNANFEDSYRVDYMTGAASATDVDDLAADAVSWQDTDLTPNTQYAVQVHAYHTSRGESSASATSTSVYTLANTPSSLSASANSETQVTASWNANSNPAGTEYYVENTTANTNSGWITATSWTSTGLTCDTSYSFRIKSRNGDATATAWSDTASVSSSACPSGGGGGYAPPSSSTGQGNVTQGLGGSVSQTLPAGTVTTVNVPVNVVSGTAVVSITPLITNPQTHISFANSNPAPSHVHRIIGESATDIELFSNGEPIQTTNVPVTISFTYTDEEIATSGTDEESLKIYRWNDNSQSWLALPSSTVDTVHDTVTATTQHFSVFSVMGTTADVLVKTYYDPKVYVVNNKGYKRHIPSAAIFVSYGYSWNDISIITPTEMASYPLSNLIKTPNNPKVYQLTGQMKRWIPNEQTFNSLGLSWQAISEINNSEFNHYTTADALSSTLTNNSEFIFTRFMQIGHTNEEVRQLQTKLKQLGYFTYPHTTGYFGPVTEASVKNFQAANSISPVGFVGPQTRAALNSK